MSLQHAWHELVLCYTYIQGFHPVGAHCTISRKRTSVDQDDFNERLISDNLQRQIIIKPVMSIDGRYISCECYILYDNDVRIATTSIQLLGEVQCSLSVNLCPLSLTTLNITKTI